MKKKLYFVSLAIDTLNHTKTLIRNFVSSKHPFTVTYEVLHGDENNLHVNILSWQEITKAEFDLAFHVNEISEWV